ncbi:MAG: hypothetical protein ACK5L3_06425 [Oscillospiraceae bacterium]
MIQQKHKKEEFTARAETLLLETLKTEAGNLAGGTPAPENANKPRAQSLLDYLAGEMKLEYLSDLKCRPVCKTILKEVLLAAEAAFYSEQDWVETCQYITKKKASSIEAAKKELLCYCET